MTPHSRSVRLGGQTYILRFTLAALAVLSRRLKCPGPKALSLCLQSPNRSARLTTARILLACLLSPNTPFQEKAGRFRPEKLAAGANEAEIAKAMSVMAEMIEEAFENV